MKKLISILAILLFMAGCSSTTNTNQSEESQVSIPESLEAKLYGKVTDAGQVVYKMSIDLGEKISATDVDEETFTVHAVGSTEEILKGTEVESFGDYDLDRTIVKTEVDGQYIYIYFMQNEGATLAYLSAARNYPVDLSYTVTLNKNLTLDVDGEEAVLSDVVVNVDTTVIDEETSKFQSVLVEDGINYQFYEAADSDKLIVWFHGNGEGDYDSSNNNVAQMLGNRGTVAWASDEAQEIFGTAHVLAFQAPDTWYYAQSDNLLEKAYEEINEVVEKYGIDPSKIMVSGASAGGYMSTRMLIKYPDLFSVALINCPALDVATDRGGETPTDEELKSIAQSNTAIWLVQGDDDTVVKTDECTVRMFNHLIGDLETVEKEFKQDLDSNFITKETAEDGKYKLSLYETVIVEDKSMLEFKTDLDQDGKDELTQYSSHWSWIYTLRNNPKSTDDTDIWTWAASYLN